MVSDRWSTVATVGLYLTENLAFATLASMSVLYFAPSAAGSGIPELMAYFNNAHIDLGYLSFNTFIAKVCSDWWKLTVLSMESIVCIGRMQ